MTHSTPPPSFSQTLPNRRRFLTSSSAALSALAFPMILKGNPGNGTGTESLKIGLIGCGGRGSGAANQALTADPNTVLYAVADAFAVNAENSLKALEDNFSTRARVPEERRFIGLDGYKKVIELCDVVLLASPPGFRPQHLTAAVEAKKHIFCEKPMAVDVAGYRVALEAVRKAKEANLNIVSGFCWHYSPSRREAFKRLHDGQIGRVTGAFATFYGSPVKPMPPASARKAEWSDVEWQVRNWYNFSWLSGDGYVEQACHSVDKIRWALNNANPLSCVAVGGRQIPNEGGNIYDHLQVGYEFADDVIMSVGSRQIQGCANQNMDYIHGTKGTLILGKGDPMITGEDRWRFRGKDGNMYQVQHDEFFAAIRSGSKINDGDFMLDSTLTAIMGRMAAYTGKKITWEDALKSEEDLAPDTLTMADKFDAGGIPIPGRSA